MTHPTLLHLQRYHEAAPRHGDLTGQIRARQLAELRDREAAERREEQERREREELEAAEANDPDTVVDLSTSEQRAAYSQLCGEWRDQDGVLG
ncbi:MAG: hypothetical protein ACLPKI_25105 [Streptosporangiaceae bacterium]